MHLPISACNRHRFRRLVSAYHCNKVVVAMDLSWAEFLHVWLFPLAAAFAHSMLIGWEREQRGQPAGIRTFGLTGTFSCFITILSVTAFRDLNPAADPMRLAAQLLPGVGFLGAGAVWREIMAGGPERVRGLTTGSALLSTVAMGIGYAAHLYLPTVLFGVLCIAALEIVPKVLPKPPLEPAADTHDAADEQTPPSP